MEVLVWNGLVESATPLTYETTEKAPLPGPSPDSSSRGNPPPSRAQTNLKFAHHVRASIAGGSNLRPPAKTFPGLMTTESAMPRASPG